MISKHFRFPLLILCSVFTSSIVMPIDVWGSLSEKFEKIEKDKKRARKEIQKAADDEIDLEVEKNLNFTKVM